MKHLLHIWMSCLLLVVTTACEKDTLANIFAPKVETGTASNIYRKGATLSGSIQLSGDTVTQRYGILFSKLQSMAEYEELEVKDGSTEFIIPVQNLEPGRTYYFCSYAHSGHSLSLGEVRNFTTTQSNAPLFETPTISQQTINTITISINLLDDGGSELIMAGFCYNESGNKEPTFLDNVVNVAPGGNSFSAEMTGLEPGKTYQIRAYGANENGLTYSDLITVNTTKTANRELSYSPNEYSGLQLDHPVACSVDGNANYSYYGWIEDVQYMRIVFTGGGGDSNQGIDIEGLVFYGNK